MEGVHANLTDHEWVAAALAFAKLQWQLHPVHIVIEVLFGLLLLYFWKVPVHKANKPRVEWPSKEELEELIAEHRSAPFSELSSTASRDSTWDCGNQLTPLTVHSYKDYSVFVQGGPYFKTVTRAMNLATFDMFSFSTNPAVVEAAKHCVRAYGVGSCGPRGFYGSVKPHIDCEANLARFLGTENCIVYSFAAATTSTLIPCFSAKSDFLLVDAGVHDVVQQGASLSRSEVATYNHQDLAHLEELMKGIVKRAAKSRKLVRRAVVTEGLFRNSGSIANLPGIVELCQKYKFRLFLDDSYGFGTLGKTGRGTPEYHGIPMRHIDVYIGSLSVSLGAVGGFCAGTNVVVEHQRLAATGYVFSASLPPYVTAAASTALAILEAEPNRVARLQRNAQLFRATVRKLVPATVAMVPAAQDVSPIVHFRPTASALLQDIAAADRKFNEAIQELQRQRIIVLRSLYTAAETARPYPSLRVVLKADMSEDEIIAVAKLLASAFKVAFSA